MLFVDTQPKNLGHQPEKPGELEPTDLRGN